MRLIEDIAMAEVWYVDAKTGEITQGRTDKNTPTSYLKLPPNAENVIHTALKGKINTSENFSYCRHISMKKNRKLPRIILLIKLTHRCL